MIHQDRFLRLLDIIDTLEEINKGYRQSIAYINKRLKEGTMTLQQANDHITGFDMANGQALGAAAVAMLAAERTHFQLMAKRNAATRQRRALKRDLKAHQAHMAQRPAPWIGMTPKTSPVEPVEHTFTSIPREELERLQAEQEGKYEQALKEIAERQAREGGPSVSPERQALVARMEELKAKLPKGKVFTDDEILGDTDGTEDPFA